MELSIIVIGFERSNDILPEIRGQRYLLNDQRTEIKMLQSRRAKPQDLAENLNL